MINKTYLEIAAELTAEMIRRGHIRVGKPTDTDWKERNYEAIHTVGWALVEMYREVADATSKAKQPRKKPVKTIPPTSNAKPVGSPKR